MDAPLIAGFEKLQLRLKIIYGRLVGEVKGIENPPRSMDRAWRGREAFQAATSEREARAERIKAALPHMEQVIRLFDPDWRPEMAKVVKPSRPKLPGPEGGWVTAAMEVLHDADAYLSGAEIVEEIARRHDLDISTVAQRQRAHTAVTGPLNRQHSHLLDRNGREPTLFALKSRKLSIPAD